MEEEKNVKNVSEEIQAWMDKAASLQRYLSSAFNDISSLEAELLAQQRRNAVVEKRLAGLVEKAQHGFKVVND